MKGGWGGKGEMKEEEYEGEGGGLTFVAARGGGLFVTDGEW